MSNQLAFPAHILSVKCVKCMLGTGDTKAHESVVTPSLGRVQSVGETGAGQLPQESHSKVASVGLSAEYMSVSQVLVFS